jgi:hypothetical protein
MVTIPRTIGKAVRARGPVGARRSPAVPVATEDQKVGRQGILRALQASALAIGTATGLFMVVALVPALVVGAIGWVPVMATAVASIAGVAAGSRGKQGGYPRPG